MLLVKFLAIFLIYGQTQAILENQTTLVHLQVLFRHGIRTTLVKYPNDPYQSYWDKFGMGQLTPPGMRQLQNYGQFIRSKYGSFLNATYDKSRVYARSTDYDRTLQSAYSFLSGLFRPNSDQQWTNVNTQSDYLPIPVHTNALATDSILHANAPCPRYEQLRNISRNTPEYLKLEEDAKDFLKNMTLFSGLTNLDYYHIWEIADRAMVLEALNLTVDKYILDNYVKIMAMNDYTFYIDFVTLEMGKLISGGLLNDIVKNINTKVAGSPSQLNIYAVHDNYIAGLQKLLNTSTIFIQPNFASGFIIELRQDAAQKYYVQILSKNNKPNQPIALTPVTVFGCDLICPLDSFVNIVKKKLVTDFTLPCLAEPKPILDQIVYYLNTLIGSK